MEKQDALKRITEIGKCDDEVQRRELLTQLGEELTKDYDSLALLTENNETLKKDNEELLRANQKLFQRIGADKEENHSNQNEENNDKPLTYENLFNEKGELK